MRLASALLLCCAAAVQAAQEPVASVVLEPQEAGADAVAVFAHPRCLWLQWAVGSATM